MMNKMMNENELENVAGGVASQDKFYTVQKGDSLSKIASRHNTSVAKLLLLNPKITNPHLIYPGDIIRLEF